MTREGFGYYLLGQQMIDMARRIKDRIFAEVIVVLESLSSPTSSAAHVCI